MGQATYQGQALTCGLIVHHINGLAIVHAAHLPRLTRLAGAASHTTSAGEQSEAALDPALARPVSQVDFEAAMKQVGPSITRGSEVEVSPGKGSLCPETSGSCDQAAAFQGQGAAAELGLSP